MADTGVVNLNAHLVRLGRSNFDILNREGLAGAPGDRSLSMEFSIVKWRGVGMVRGAVSADVILCRVGIFGVRAYLASDGLDES